VRGVALGVERAGVPRGVLRGVGSNVADASLDLGVVEAMVESDWVARNCREAALESCNRCLGDWKSAIWNAKNNSWHSQLCSQAFWVLP